MALWTATVFTEWKDSLCKDDLLETGQSQWAGKCLVMEMTNKNKNTGFFNHKPDATTPRKSIS